MFKAGDKVEHIQGQGVIVYGPFEGISGYEPRYLVRKDNGKHFTGGESYLTAVQEFEHGDQVNLAGTPHTVVAGPFSYSGTAPWYVLENEHGHTTCGLETLRRARQGEYGDPVVE